jgi:ring-1,2-phenylacetyl-CoA epoxidase subunit PaaC
MSRDAFLSVVTALADDELVLGHRHSEWTGYAPYIEEDVAFSSIAQDEIGHAAQLYALIGEENGANPDHLALGRERDDYRHAVLCELPNRDWAFTLARHWLYDHADALRLEALGGTAEVKLAQLVAKIRREERYHLIHADAWMTRVANGPVEGRSKLIAAVGEAFAPAAALFEPYQQEDEAVKEGILPVPSNELRERFVRQSTSKLDELGLPTGEITGALDEAAEFVASSSGDLIASPGEETAQAAPSRTALGGRQGRHTSDFEQLWDDLTYTFRQEPEATW